MRRVGFPGCIVKTVQAIVLECEEQGPPRLCHQPTPICHRAWSPVLRFLNRCSLGTIACWPPDNCCWNSCMVSSLTRFLCGKAAWSRALVLRVSMKKTKIMIAGPILNWNSLRHSGKHPFLVVSAPFSVMAANTGCSSARKGLWWDGRAASMPDVRTSSDDLRWKLGFVEAQTQVSRVVLPCPAQLRVI